MKLLPIPQPIYQELMSGLDELDDAYGKTAEAANARIWLKALRDYWPTMPDLEGKDMFAEHPVSGEAHDD